MAFNWIRRWWLSRLTRAPRTPLHSTPSRPRQARPLLEELERRWLPSVTLSVSDPLPFPEGDFGTSNMVFVVSRNGDLAPTVQASYHTVDGTAHAGVDYVATSGTVTIASGQSTATVDVPVIGNTIFQSNRSFSLALTDLLPGVAFAAPQSFGTGQNPNAVAVGDFTGDGKPDLAIANVGSGTVSVLLNTTAPGAATPTFAAQVTFAVGNSPDALAVADVNGDGKPDLIAANALDNTVSVLLNATPLGATVPAFAAQATFAVGNTPDALAVADVNGDGKSDLIVANQRDKTVSVLLNTTATGAAVPSFAPQATFAVGTNPLGLAVADVNGDGKPDIAVANVLDNTVSVLLNTTAAGAAVPSFAPQATFAVGTNPGALAFGDVNGDGRPDLAVTNGSGTVSVLLNTTAPGAAVASFAPQATFAVGDVPDAVRFVDVNGDGKLDLVVANFDDSTVSVFLNTTAPGANAPSFAAQQTFAAGAAPTALAVADFNGDGLPDLAVTGEASNASGGLVSVLLNTRVPVAIAPAFAGQATFTTGNAPLAVTVADLNGDGKPDLAVANYTDNDIAVLLNTTAPGATSPSFAAAATFAVGQGPTAIVAGDLNGDGRPDLAVANRTDGTVSILLNETAPGATVPTFAAAATFAVGKEPSALVEGDVNGDGRPDLAVANYGDGTVSVLLNQTAPGATVPAFAPQTTFGVDNGPRALALGDVNGDGLPDLAVADYGAGIVSVLLNQTAPGAAVPAFAPPEPFLVGNGPRAVALADLNGDGRPDLVTANYTDGTISVLLNQAPPGAAFPSFAPQVTFAVGSKPATVALADVTGDGRPDLLVDNFGDNTVSVLVNTTAPGATVPAFAPQVLFATGGGPLGMAVADFNGDGVPDLVTANSTGNTVSVLLDTAGPPFTVPTPFGAAQLFGTGSTPFAVAVLDVNGDNKPDLAVANFSDNTVSVLLNTTAPGAVSPSFAPAVTFAVGNGPSALAFGDVNGDGKPDLAVTNYSDGTVSVLLNTTPTGATVPSFAAQVAFAVGNGPFSVALQDLNDDKKPDLVVVNHADDTVSVLLNTTPTGAATPTFAAPVPFAVGDNPVSVAVGDVNGDGKPDLAVANYGDNTVSVLLNTTANGAAVPAFAPQATFAVGANPAAVLLEDLNGDGVPDLAVANSGDATVSVLINTTAMGAATPSFAPQATFAVGGNPHSLTAADVNGDGKADLAVANYADGTVSVLLNETPTGATTATFAAQTVVRAGQGPFSLVAADFNTDNKPDLAVADHNANAVSVLLNSPVSLALTRAQATGTIMDDDAPVTVTASSGTTPQSALVGAAFSVPLAVDVRNAADHLVQSVTVTFSAPATGPSGTFAGGGTTFVTTTDANGHAVAPAFTANGTPGNFQVTATATGGASPLATFSLSNTSVADLGVTLGTSSTTAVPGTAVSYTITVSNAGPSTVTSLMLTPTLPASLLSATFTPASGSYNSSTGAWTGLSLATGQSVTMTLSGSIDPAATGTLTVSATVAPPAGTTDPNPGNNTASNTLTLTPVADLGVTIATGGTTAVPGTTVNYTITVSNVGPSTVTSLMLTPTLPAPLLGATFTPASGSYSSSTGAWTGLSLATGQTVTMTLAGSIDPAATGTLSVSVAVAPPAGTTDVNPNNNTASSTVTLTPVADLAASIATGSTTAVPGTGISYTIAVGNAGPSTVTSVTLTATLPASLLGAMFIPASGSYSSSTGAWTGLSLAPGQTVTMTLAGNIDPAATGTFTVSAAVAPPAGTTDPNPGNNSSSVTSTLAPQGDLSVTIAPNQTTAIPGAVVGFTIVFSNSGPSTATPVPVSDDFLFLAFDDEGWTSVVSSGTVSGNSPSGGENISDTLTLGPNSAVTYTISGTLLPSFVSSSDTLGDTATITAPAGFTDTNPTNNSATATSPVSAQGDLSVSLSANPTTLAAGQTVTFNLVVSNSGPSTTAGAGATVTDSFPATLTGVTWTSTASGIPSGNTAGGTGNISDTLILAPSSSVTYTVTATVAASATGTITNTATVTGPAGFTDTNPANNTATVTLTVAAPPATQAAPTVVFVNPAFTGAPGTTPPGAPAGEVIGFNAFATIQAGLNAVAPGGTVNVAAGTYTENLTFAKSVIVVGAGSGTTILAGKNVGAGLGITTANGVAIQGLTVKGFMAGLVAGSATTFLSLTDVVIAGNQFGGTIEGVTTLLITGGSGNDTFFVTPDAVARAGENPLSLLGVRNFTVDGGGGTNTLTVFLNATVTLAFNTVWVTAGGISTQFGGFLLFYRDTGGTFGGGVNIALSGVSGQPGSGATAVVIQRQQPGVPITIYAEGGNVTFNVAVTTSSTYQNLTLDAGSGPATVGVFDMSGGATGKVLGLPDGTLDFVVSYASGSTSTIHEQNFQQPALATTLVTM